MRKLRFEGYSDDTFGEYGLTGDDVDNCASMNPIQCVVDCGEFGRLMVIGQYSKLSCDNGCWMIGVSKVDEYDDFPDWYMQFREGVESGLWDPASHKAERRTHCQSGGGEKKRNSYACK